MTTAPAALRADLETFSDEQLYHLVQEAERILQARNAAELPALVRTAVCEALADEGDTRTPVSVAFTTTEWENGFAWDESDAQVTFADGSTRRIEIDDTLTDEALTDHASLQERIGADHTLTVVFEPPTVQMH